VEINPSFNLPTKNNRNEKMKTTKMRLKHTILLLVLSAGSSQAANTIYRNAVLADNPVAYWEFDETSGSTAIDSSGNGRHATYTGSLTLNSSTVTNLGSSVDLTGGHINVPTVGGAYANLSIEFWVNAASLGGITAIFATDGYGDTQGHINLNPDVVQSAAPPSNPADLYASSATIDLNTWYYVVVTKDGAGGPDAHKIYVNGIEAASGSLVAGVHNMDNSQIGAWTGTRNLDGRVDEVAVYDKVLSPAQISAHYAAAVPEPSSTALLGLAGLALVMRRRK